MEYIFMSADASVLEDVYALIDQRIAWMDEVGIRQWNVTNYWDAYPKSYYVHQMNLGNLYILKKAEDNKVVGAIVLLEEDSRWNDCSDVSAYYLHNFVTDSRVKGAGEIILESVHELAVRNKKTRVRLDCAIDNVRLNHYYENKGYVFAGQCADGPYIGNKREKRLESS
ncbi:GNAT family N-acetyltransferase [Mesobacillus subterraneus]|uniref:GNAT family N-acetyltransferase n=1 Tax=Mesobacillus subterraneus TaxID=285983 RepID=A0A3R9EAE1_9BACI|nr:GNAT family N-acetyltransferase [Mesobacillus subterraneus]RSD29571.1 GNAT family N-acetyltransferase [Mesobacillus subterraneus]